MDDLRLKLRTALAFAADVAAETIWPTRCAVCDVPGELLCADCARKLPSIDQCLACPTCGAPYGRVQCTECNATVLAAANLSRFPLDGLTSTFIADDATRRIVKTYKDQGERRLARMIAKSIAVCVPPAWLAQPSALTFVPDTRASMKRRGFDHAHELASLTADMLGCDCLGLLERPTSIDQRTLTRAERFANMADAIKLCPAIPPLPRVILLDDVCTTGATLYAAATALRRSGIQQVFAATFGRVLD